MRLTLPLLALALTASASRAHADTLFVTYTANGTATPNSSGRYGVQSTSFSEFDPSLGTLNNVTISLAGNATYTGSSPSGDRFFGVTAASDPQNVLVFPVGNTSTPGRFPIFAAGTVTYPLTEFEGTGSAALLLEFTAPTTTSGVLGLLYYDYTPAAPTAVTPRAI